MADFDELRKKYEQQGPVPLLPAQPAPTTPPAESSLINAEEFRQRFESARPSISAMPGPGQAGPMIQRGVNVVAPAIGGVVGAAVGGVPGAGLGSMAGAGVAQAPRPYLTGQTPTIQEAGIDVLMAGLFGAAGEGLGQTISLGFSKILQGASRNVPESIKVTQRMLERAGASLTPGQYTRSMVLQGAEFVAESGVTSFVGKPAITAIKEQATQAIPKLADEFLATYGTKVSPRVISEMVLKSRETALSLNKVARHAAWKEVDALTANAPPVNMANVTSLFGKANIDRGLKAAGLDAEDFLGDISFSKAQELKSALGSVARQSAKSVDDEAIKRSAGKVEALIGRAMEDAAGAVSPEARQAYNFAREFHKEGVEKYENALLRTLVKAIEKQPSNIDDLLASQLKVDTFTRIKAAVDPYTFEALQASVTNRIVTKAVNPQTGFLNGNQLLKFIDQDLGPDASLLLKNPQALKDLATAASVVHGEPGAKGGGLVFFRIVQASAAGAALSFSMTPMGAVILLTPPVLNKILSNPTWMRALTRAATKASSPHIASQAIGQLAREVNDALREEDMR